jgi:TRAP-type C4-dicarboxylate transport system substrate-binding protein
MSIALQWYTKVKYMVDVPLADAAGAVLISKKYFDTLPKDLQEILLRNGRIYMAKLTELNRQDNERSIDELRKRGIGITTATEVEIRQYVDVGAKARRQLVGRLYTEEFLNRVEKEVSDFRKTEKGVK